MYIETLEMTLLSAATLKDDEKGQICSVHLYCQNSQARRWLNVVPTSKEVGTTLSQRLPYGGRPHVRRIPHNYSSPRAVCRNARLASVSGQRRQ